MHRWTHVISTAAVMLIVQTVIGLHSQAATLERQLTLILVTATKIILSIIIIQSWSLSEMKVAYSV